jgi:hypothetical protein
MPEDSPPNLYALRTADPTAYACLVEDLREAVSGYLGTASLRQASREIGMSPTGLQNFLNGTEPHVTTLRKLHDWHERIRNPATSQ